MDRRSLIKNAGIAGVLAAGIAPAVHAQAAVRWRLASSFPKSLDTIYGSADVFAKAVKVRALGADAAELADRYFLENLVRIHRAGEGASYDGIKPTGTVLGPEVLAADEAMAAGNLKPLMALIPADKHAPLQRRFDKARDLQQFDVNDLAAGRAYIAAYVSFYKYAEGEEHHHHHH